MLDQTGVLFWVTRCISLKSVEKLITPQLSRAPVPCILQILTTFNLYSGRPRVGLSVNNKQMVGEAMVKVSRRGWQSAPSPPLPARYVSRNGLTIRKVKKSHKISSEKALYMNQKPRRGWKTPPPPFAFRVKKKESTKIRNIYCRGSSLFSQEIINIYL